MVLLLPFDTVLCGACCLLWWWDWVWLVCGSGIWLVLLRVLVFVCGVVVYYGRVVWCLIGLLVIVVFVLLHLRLIADLLIVLLFVAFYVVVIIAWFCSC